MNDFADDLVRKRSALYNFNVDMNLCPICTFLYALTPLGFIKYHNDFLFFNDNSSIQKLCDSNSDGGKNNEDEVKENSKLEGKYYKIYQYIENAILYSTKDNINRNIQVITRKTLDNGEIRYEFDILDGYLIKTLNHKRIKKNLEYFATVNVIKMKDEYLSLFMCIRDRLSSYDVHEYQIMQDFILNLKNKDIRDQLWNTIHGKGAFRRFKDLAARFGILEDWFLYLNQQYRKIAIKWCRENNIIYVE